MPSEGPESGSVASVREELRRLGYLDRGLDRFVLEGAFEGTASALRACARAAFRVGLAGGLLFGVAATLAAVGLDPRLLLEPQDLLVLALYLVAATAVVVGALALLAGLVAAFGGRRLTRPPGPTFARNVGLLLAGAGLLYLTLWFRTHLQGAPLAAQGTALGLGTVLCLALGRFGTLAAVAVLAASGLGSRLPEAAVSRHQLRPVLVAAAVLFGGFVVAASLFGRDEMAGAPDFAVVPTGLRVRVVGIDGLERRMTEQMLARGEMPRLAALLRRGAAGRIAAESPSACPPSSGPPSPPDAGPRPTGYGARGRGASPGCGRPGPRATTTPSSPPSPRPAISSVSRGGSRPRPCCARSRRSGTSLPRRDCGWGW